MCLLDEWRIAVVFSCIAFFCLSFSWSLTLAEEHRLKVFENMALTDKS
jgi:hypothetical protein